jgi:hypothetical protein
MNYFEVNDQRFLDPYAVDGEERVDRFIHNFKEQELFGASGVLEQSSILSEAQRHLAPQHFKRFCDGVDLPQRSWDFVIMSLIGDRYRQLSEILHERLGATALLHLLGLSHDEAFDGLVKQGNLMIYMDAGEIRERIVEARITAPQAPLN